MPRRKIDTTTEHRISLGTYERNALQEAFSIQKENQRLDAITATAQAVGTAVGGLGIAGAALLLGAYLVPNLFEKITDKASGPGGWLDRFTDILLPSTPIAFRRAAQELAKRRGEIWRDIDSFCSVNADTYDKAACELAHEQKRELSEAEDAFIAELKEAEITRGTAFWAFIFGGLSGLEDQIDPQPSSGNPSVDYVKEQRDKPIWEWALEGIGIL